MPDLTPTLGLPLQQAAGGGMSSIFLVVVMGFIFYFFLWKPQSDERKRHTELVAGLKKGDKVVSEGGICGSVVEVRDDRVVVEVAKNTRLTLLKESIDRLEDTKKAKDKKGA